MTEIDRAEVIARLAHGGQFMPSDGMDFILHPRAVAALLPDELKPAGWLHDVLEDTEILPVQLAAAGISEHTIEIVKMVTRYGEFSQGKHYAAYIQHIITYGGSDAMRVKLADLTHNLRPSCPARLIERYTIAHAKLTEVLEGYHEDSLHPKTL